jgi:hypothetical protein
MPEQREEDILHHVLAVADPDTAGAYVPKQRVAETIEQDEHVLLESRLFARVRGPARRKRRKAQRGFRRGVADHV